MVIDLLVLAILLLTALHGYLRRFPACLISTGGTVLGYVLAFALAVPVGRALAGVLGLTPLVQPLVGGVAVFTACSLVAGVAAFLVQRRRRRRIADGEIPDRLSSKLGGAGLGLVRGAILALFVAWLGQQLSVVFPSVAENSRAARVATDTARALARSVLVDDDGADAALHEITADVLADPAGAAVAAREISARPATQELIRDQGFARDLVEGRSRAAAFHPRLTALLADPGIRRIARARGWLDDDFDQAAFQAQLAARFALLAPKLRALAEDPEIQDTFADPEVRELAETRNIPGLLTHPRVAPLVEKILVILRTDDAGGLGAGPAAMSPEPPGDNGSAITGGSARPPAATPGPAPEAAPESETLFRWVDEHGVEHLSNLPPPR